MRQAYKSTDLQPEDRSAVERLVGRRLQSDEAVRVTILKVDDMAAAQDAEGRFEQPPPAFVNWPKASTWTALQFAT